ncbi:MAG: hypothetical protein COW78_08575 [Bdellovibrio sp. CG22_combo_CG10-13_8_21_14_all_39_27]|nr:MAG: hypothetical protein COW78_08575 [Bdellovibrio sp. CG22_combo_CG10-13_8_21_14_all_39_27]
MVAGVFAPKIMARELEFFSRTSPNTIILGEDEQSRLQALHHFYQTHGTELDPKVIKQDLFKTQNSSQMISKLEEGFKKECYLMQADPKNLDQKTLQFLQRNFTVIYV